MCDEFRRCLLQDVCGLFIAGCMWLVRLRLQSLTAMIPEKVSPNQNGSEFLIDDTCHRIGILVDFTHHFQGYSVLLFVYDQSRIHL